MNDDIENIEKFVDSLSPEEFENLTGRKPDGPNGKKEKEPQVAPKSTERTLDEELASCPDSNELHE